MKTRLKQTPDAKDIVITVRIYFCKQYCEEVAKTKQGLMNNFEKILNLAIRTVSHCEQCLYSYRSLPHMTSYQFSICSMGAVQGKIDVYFCYESLGPQTEQALRTEHILRVLPCVKVLTCVKGERRQQRLNDQ